MFFVGKICVGKMCVGKRGQNVGKMWAKIFRVLAVLKC